MPPVFSPLDRRHDREGFSCGVAPLDAYLRQWARKDAERDVAVVFVMSDEAAPATILGYYTLSAFTIEARDLPESWQKKLPRYPRLPATLLGRLARDQRHPGLGSGLLMDALRRSCTQAGQVASLALVVEAKDERAVGFYRRFGFQRLGSEAQRLYLAMETIRQLVGA